MAMSNRSNLFQCLLTVCIAVQVLHRCEGIIKIETFFKYYEHNCEEWDFFDTEPCDPMFTFCWARPRQESKARAISSECEYGFKSESKHYSNQKRINLSKETNIGGIRNPWILRIRNFLDPQIMFVMRTRDRDSNTGADHMVHMTKTMTSIVYGSREESVEQLYTLTKSHHTFRMSVRMYCEDDFFSNNCDVECHAQDSDQEGHYTCKKGTGEKECLPGWTGSMCKTAAEAECNDTVQCVNGTCVQRTPSFHQCECDEHFSGTLCEVLDNPCTNTSCANSGVCVPDNNTYTYTCKCTELWEGDHCQWRRDPCDFHPCQNSGVCNSTIVTEAEGRTYSFTCNCTEVWEGDNCQSRKDPCDFLPCKNGGNCSSNASNTDFSCNCSYPYSGQFCETDLRITTVAQETTMYIGRVDPPQGITKNDDSGFQPAILLILLVIPLAIFLIVFIVCLRRRRKKKEPKPLPDLQPTTVVFAGDNLAFENTLYNDSETANGQRNGLPPTTPTEDDEFHSAKPLFYPDSEENMKAAGGCQDTDDDSYLKPVTASGSLAAPTRTRVKENPYEDFNALTPTHNLRQQDSFDDNEANHYQELDEICLAVKGLDDIFKEHEEDDAPSHDADLENSRSVEASECPYSDVPLNSPADDTNKTEDPAHEVNKEEECDATAPKSSQSSETPAADYDHLALNSGSRKPFNWTEPGPYAMSDPFQKEATSDDDEDLGDLGLPSIPQDSSVDMRSTPDREENPYKEPVKKTVNVDEYDFPRRGISGNPRSDPPPIVASKPPTFSRDFKKRPNETDVHDNGFVSEGEIPLSPPPPPPLSFENLSFDVDDPDWKSVLPPPPIVEDSPPTSLPKEKALTSGNSETSQSPSEHEEDKPLSETGNARPIIIGKSYNFGDDHEQDVLDADDSAQLTAKSPPPALYMENFGFSSS